MLILFLDHICTTVSLKPRINLCLFKRLNFNVRLVSSLTYCKNWVLFCSNNTEDYFFKFICWYYVSNSFTNCTPFLNRAWIKRQIKSLGSSWKSLYLVLHTDLFWYSPSLQLPKYDWKYEDKSIYIYERKIFHKDHPPSPKDSRVIAW